MKLKNDVLTLLMLLPTGPRRPIHGAEIARRMGLRSDGSVRLLVNEACSQGMPICSNQDGYYLPEKASDIHETLAHRRSRVAKQNEAIAGLERSLAGVA